MMRIDLPDPTDASNVISIEEVRHEYERKRTGRNCLHNRITVSSEEIVVKCRDCGERIATNAWILDNLAAWVRVRNIYERTEEARKRLDEKRRVRCQHCHRLTGTTREARFEIVREQEGAGGA